MVQSYKNFLTYASKSQEKISFFSFYKQISMSMITCCVFQFPSRTIFCTLPCELYLLSFLFISILDIECRYLLLDPLLYHFVGVSKMVQQKTATPFDSGITVL